MAHFLVEEGTHILTIEIFQRSVFEVGEFSLEGVIVRVEFNNIGHSFIPSVPLFLCFMHFCVIIVSP